MTRTKDIARKSTASSDVASDVARALMTYGPWYKIHQFRRHRDWVAAFNRARDSHRHLFFKHNSQWMLPDENAEVLIEAADQEFIDEIIRREPSR